MVLKIPLLSFSNNSDSHNRLFILIRALFFSSGLLHRRLLCWSHGMMSSFCRAWLVCFGQLTSLKHYVVWLDMFTPLLLETLERQRYGNLLETLPLRKPLARESLLTSLPSASRCNQAKYMTSSICNASHFLFHTQSCSLSPSQRNELVDEGSYRQLMH